MQQRIYYHHTDCGGVVYYANYLKFLEEARTEWLEQRGISVKSLMDKGLLFVVYRQEIDYKFPAVYGDTITVETKVTGLSDFRIEFYYETKNQDGRLLTKAKTVLVCVGKSLEATPLPDEIKQVLQKDVQPAPPEIKRRFMA